MGRENLPVKGFAKNWFSWENVWKCALGVWLIAQVVLIIMFWDCSQRSDQSAYMRMAQDCYDRGVWYPNADYINASYIWAPGLINFFILQLKLFGTLKVNYILNLAMNIGILWNVFTLSNRWFGRRTALIAITLFCLTYSNIMVVLPAGTEIPFLFLSLMAFTLSLKKKCVWLIMAGVMFAFANWIRPLVIIFLPVLLLYFYMKKYRVKHYIALFFPLIFFTLSFGWMAQRQIGHFVYQSTTSAVNLIMTANDKAYGGVSTSLLSDSTSTCFIEDAQNKTFLEKDSIWKSRSIAWIKEHPAKFMGLYVLKIAGLYVEDSWAERPILGGDAFVDKAAHGKTDKKAIIERAWNMLSKSIVYYIILVLFVIAVVKYHSVWYSDKGYLLLIFVLGTLATCIFCVSPRYHYPIMFAITIWAAYGIDRMTTKKRKEDSPC